ncbi:MAG TPA: acyl-CoA dehydrogenase family protein [Candidatus Binataceae bacterium]|nr:acyl-CoA dehydrogenase family protein [Candidatus Binataceae bacterium]
MDFNFSEEAEAFRREFRAWLEVNRPEPRPDDDQIAEFLEAGSAGYKTRLAWHKKLHAGGWVGITWPKAYGGRGATLEQSIVFGEELGRVKAPTMVNGLGIALVGPTLMHWGTEAQKQRYLPKILSADEIWCQGYSEPNAGSDVAALQTRAVEDGDDFIVNGQKVWTSGAHHADWCILLARTDSAAPKHKGISYLLVDMHSPGVTVKPLVQMTGDRGFNEVFFEDVRVPKANLVGEKNQGWQVAVTTLMFERSSIGSGQVRDTLSGLKELAAIARQTSRNGGTAWEDSSVRQKLAGFSCEAAGLRYTNLRQLTRRLKGLPPGPEGSGSKLAVSDLNLRIAKFAMELLGPYSQFERDAGLSLDGGKWSNRMLGARMMTIAGGTSEIQHNIIGERALGLPKG